MNQMKKLLESKTLEELTEIENQIKKIKEKKKNPQKDIDKQKLQDQLKKLFNKYKSIEVTANLPQIKIQYHIGPNGYVDDLLFAFDNLTDEYSEMTVNEIADSLLDYVSRTVASSYKTYGQNNSAAQKRLVQEYMEENDPPCFDFVKFFAKDVWRDIQKDFKELAKEIHQFNSRHNSNSDS